MSQVFATSSKKQLQSNIVVQGFDADLGVKWPILFALQANTKQKSDYPLREWSLSLRGLVLAT